MPSTNARVRAACSPSPPCMSNGSPTTISSTSCCADEGGDRRAVAFGVVRAAERREGQRMTVAIRDGDADPPVADVEPEEAGHGRGGRGRRARSGWLTAARLAAGACEGAGAGPADAPGGPSTVRSSRESNPVTVEAHDGQRTTFASPYGASAASASACVLPLTSERSSAGVEDRDPLGPGRRLEGHLAVLADGPLPDLHVDRALDELVVRADLVLELRVAISLTGRGSTAITEPVADRARS